MEYFSRIIYIYIYIIWTPLFYLFDKLPITDIFSTMVLLLTTSGNRTLHVYILSRLSNHLEYTYVLTQRVTNTWICKPWQTDRNDEQIANILYIHTKCIVKLPSHINAITCTFTLFLLPINSPIVKSDYLTFVESGFLIQLFFPHYLTCDIIILCVRFSLLVSGEWLLYVS